jgi:hypothetical protein
VKIIKNERDPPLFTGKLLIKFQNILRNTTQVIGSWRGVLDKTLCDKVCQLLAAGQWFFPGTLVSSTNKMDCHDITEILLEMTLNTISLNQNLA